MNIKYIPSSKLRENLSIVKDAILLDGLTYRITENNKDTGLVLTCIENLKSEQKQVKKKQPDFKKLTQKTKGIFESDYPYMNGVEIVNKIRRRF